MKDEISFPKMKAAIQKTGGLFYQYRPCKREATTIFDYFFTILDVFYRIIDILTIPIKRDFQEVHIT